MRTSNSVWFWDSHTSFLTPDEFSVPYGVRPSIMIRTNGMCHIEPYETHPNVSQHSHLANHSYGESQEIEATTHVSWRDYSFLSTTLNLRYFWAYRIGTLDTRLAITIPPPMRNIVPQTLTKNMTVPKACDLLRSNFLSTERMSFSKYGDNATDRATRAGLIMLRRRYKPA